MINLCRIIPIAVVCAALAVFGSGVDVPHFKNEAHAQGCESVIGSGVLVCKAPSGGGGAVAKVDSCTAQPSGNGVTTFTYTGTTASSTSSQNAMVAYMAFTVAATGITATWNGTSMTAISGAIAQAGSPGSQTLAMFGLLAPAAGNDNLVLNWTTAGHVTVCAITFSGVNQTGFTSAFKNGTSATGNSTSASVSVTSATNHIAAGMSYAGDATPTVTMGNTADYTDNSSVFADGGNHDVGAATVNLTATYTASTHWASVGADVSN